CNLEAGCSYRRPPAARSSFDHLAAQFRANSCPLFPEQDDPVGVGAFGVVVDAPAVRGFGEFLLIDQNQLRLQSGLAAAGDYGFLESNLAGANFADLEREVSARAKDPPEFMEDAGHRFLPGLKFAG